MVELFFGEDDVCVSNYNFLIPILKRKGCRVILNIVNEYTTDLIRRETI